MRTNLSEATDADLGQWVAGSDTYSPVEFNIQVVNLARRFGFELEEHEWLASLPILRGEKGEIPFDLIEDLGYTSDEALAWMNAQLPDWMYFDFIDGLVLCKDEETA